MNGDDDDDDDDGGVGVKDIIFASREGFLGGGLFIYIYIYFSPSSPKKGRGREEVKERGYKGTSNLLWVFLALHCRSYILHKALHLPVHRLHLPLSTEY